MSTTTPAVQSNGINGAVKDVPINLRALYGGRYKIAWDKSYYAQYGANAVVDDPWLQIIPGVLGHVYPFGGDFLAASTNSHGPIANKLMALPSCRVHQDGDDGATVVFRAEALPEVAKIIRARTRRTLSPAQRAKFVEAGRAHRYRRQRRVTQGRCEQMKARED